MPAFETEGDQQFRTSVNNGVDSCRHRRLQVDAIDRIFWTIIQETRRGEKQIHASGSHGYRKTTSSLANIWGIVVWRFLSFCCLSKVSFTFEILLTISPEEYQPKTLYYICTMISITVIEKSVNISE